MPTLDWKSVELNKRTQLTAQILNLTQEYLWIVSIIAITLIGLLGLTVVGDENISSWHSWGKQAGSGLIGGAITLCFARMAYVAWRDFDIVRLQKHIIDASAASDTQANEVKAAEETISSIKSAGLRKIEIKAPTAWQ